jgi:hypothetical protein
MSLLDRLRADHPTVPTTGRATMGRLAARLDLAREHPIRSHEPQGWLGGALLGAWSALLSLFAVALPMLVVWATSSTSTSWGGAVRVCVQAWLFVHGVALTIDGGSLHLLPLGLTLLPLWLCWRAGRRLGTSAPPLDVGSPLGALRSLTGPALGLGGGYAAVLTGAALLAAGSGVRPVWWHALVSGFVLGVGAGGAAALRTVVGSALPEGRGRGRRVLADWLRLPSRVRRTARPALLAAGALVALGTGGLVLSLLVQHQRVLAVHAALDPGALGAAVLTLGQLAVVPNLALWGVAWFAGPGFAVGVGTAVTPAASTIGLLPLVPVLGVLPSPGPLAAVWQAAVLVPVVVGAVLGWRCARSGAATGGSVVSTVLDAVVAAAFTSVVLTLLVLLSAGSAGPGHLADVGPSAWRVGLALLGELGAGAAVTAWIAARRS